MFDKIKNTLKGLKQEITKDSGNQQQHQHQHQPQHDNHQHANGAGACDARIEYFAVLSKSGSFYEGDIPDISFSRAKITLCSSYDELLTKLTKKLDEEVERCKRLNQSLPVKTPVETVKAQNAGKEIVGICSSVKL